MAGGNTGTGLTCMRPIPTTGGMNKVFILLPCLAVCAAAPGRGQEPPAGQPAGIEIGTRIPASDMPAGPFHIEKPGLYRLAGNRQEGNTITGTLNLGSE